MNLWRWLQSRPTTTELEFLCNQNEIQQRNETQRVNIWQDLLFLFLFLLLFFGINLLLLLLSSLIFIPSLFTF